MSSVIGKTFDLTGITRPEESQQHVQNLIELSRAFGEYQKENQAARQAAMQNQLMSMNPLLAQYERLYGKGTAPQISQFSQPIYPENRGSFEELYKGIAPLDKARSGSSGVFGFLEDIPVVGDLFKGIGSMFGI